MNFLNLDAFTIIARVIVILMVLPLHEYAHAFVAKKFGDYTAESSGRLSLNPFTHIDPVGAVLLLLTGFGWAKPVPVNPNAMRNPRNGIIWTSLAGPLSNLIAAFISLTALRVIGCIPIAADNTALFNTLVSICTILGAFSSINMGLAVFNLIPVPPLDGSKVLMQFLPIRAVIWMQRNQMIISLVFLVLIISPALDIPLSFITTQVYRLFYFLTDWVPLLMNLITG
ncbi:MAG: site-2 protease family protein [Oscillospiraceae bacterium]|nr:site-2 protease family protein [Oscillospiraceae bacterium]